MSTIRGPAKTSRVMILAVAVAVLLAIGGGLWALTRNRGENNDNVVTPQTIDAPLATTGTVIIEVMEGASGYIETADDPASRKQLDPALLKTMGRVGLKVPAKRTHLYLELAGFIPYDVTFDVGPGEKVVHKVPMTAAPAKLAIQIEPAGVQVTLAGRLLGDAPKTFDNLTPGKDLELVLSKAGYQPLTKKITLEAGKTVALKETLKEITKVGKLTISIKGGGWANVIIKGKNYGPNKTLAGLNSFSVPVGKQVVLLESGDGKKKKTLTVTIAEGKSQSLEVSLD